MSVPCISIVIPCYNMEAYLDDCLRSVLSQTLTGIEAICVNDGSKDRTGEMLDAYHARDSRVVVIHQPNRGVAAARNAALNIASGKYIAFLDPDDFYPNSGTLELLYRKAEENGALICGGSFSNYRNETGTVRTEFGGDYAGYTFHREGFASFRDYQFDYGYHRFLYNRAFLAAHDIRFPPYLRFQDPPFFLRAMIAAERFYAIPDVVYRYRVGIQAHASTWPAPKLHDMMRGYRDDLLISAQAQLPELHALTVRRFEADDVCGPIVSSIREGNGDTAALLQEVGEAIDTGLLRQAGVRLRPGRSYVLRHRRELSRPPAVSALCSLARRLSYGISAAAKDCREHGIRHTLQILAARAEK